MTSVLETSKKPRHNISQQMYAFISEVKEIDDFLEQGIGLNKKKKKIKYQFQSLKDTNIPAALLHSFAFSLERDRLF